MIPFLQSHATTPPLGCLIQRPIFPLFSLRRVSTAVSWLLSAVYTSGCFAPANEDFSPANAGNVLEHLTNIRTEETGDRIVPRCQTVEASIKNVAEYIAFHLSDELGFSCTEREISTTVQDPRTLWMLQHHDLVSWRGPMGTDAVIITLPYANNLTRPSERRANFVPLAAAIEGLRVLLRSGALDTRLVIVLASEAPSATGPNIPTVSVAPEEEIRYTTVVSPAIHDAVARMSPLNGAGSGWVIASTLLPGRVASHRTVLTQRRTNAPQDNINRDQGPTSLRLLAIPGELTLHAMYQLPRDDTDTLSLQELGHAFIREFRLAQIVPPLPVLSGRWQRICTYTCEDDRVYWALGILLPLLILYTGAKVLVVEADTVVEKLADGIRYDWKRKRRLLRTIRRLRRLEDRLKRKQASLPAIGDDQESPLSMRLSRRGSPADRDPIAQWKQLLKAKKNTDLKARIQRNRSQLIQARSRWKALRDKLNAGHESLGHWQIYREQVGERLKKLGKDMWGHVSDAVESRDTSLAVVGGVVACALAFLSGLAVESYTDAEIWSVSSLVLIIFVAGTLYRKHKLGAFAIGGATICFIGLDTIELSPLTNPMAVYQLATLFDSQTVSLMFGCAALLLSVQASMVSPRKARATVQGQWASASEKQLRAVRRSRSLGRKRERRYMVTLSMWYLLLVYHTVCQALWGIVSGGRSTGLMTVTSIAVVTLLLPVLVLWTGAPAKKVGGSA